MDQDPETLAVEDVMAEIRRSLEDRREVGLVQDPDWGRYRGWDGTPEELEQSLRELNTRWNQIYERLALSRSRIPVLGRLWDALRHRVHAEVRSYLDPMIYRQVELNAAVVRTLNGLTAGLYGGSLAATLEMLYREVVELRARVRQLEEQGQQGAAGRPAPEEPPS